MHDGISWQIFLTLLEQGHRFVKVADSDQYVRNLLDRQLHSFLVFILTFLY
jgi:hypothetical protein